MNLLPIISRDLKAELLSGRLGKGRLAAAAASGLALMALVLTEQMAGGLSVPRLLRVLPLTGLGPFVLLVISLNRGANLLESERREGTLGLLLLTRLSSGDVVWGKLLQALILELTLCLALGPALVLPLLAAGVGVAELALAGLGCLNVLFFGLGLGLLISVVTGGASAAGWCLFLLLPVLAFATPVGWLLPSGWVREALQSLQWFNPCQAVAHAQGAAAGLRPGNFWWALLVSHGLGWGFLMAAGRLLLPLSQRSAGAVARGGRSGGWVCWNLSSHWRRWRRPLLEKSAILWLTTRQIWPTLHVWLWLACAALLWGWLSWVGWARRGINVTIVLAGAAAITWAFVLLAVVPREACRRLVEDRQTGALELLLCTPLEVAGIVRGQWLALRRQFLAPVLAVITGAVLLMVIGYVTFGFGGMLDPEDRPLWLLAWSAGLFLLPVWLAALCWVAMRRALVARTVSEASGAAFVQVLLVPGFVVWGLYWLLALAGAALGWSVILLLLLAGFLGTPAVLAWRARLRLLTQLRQAAAERSSPR